MEKNRSLAIYFSEDEYDKVLAANSHLVLKESQMLMVMIKNGLDGMRQEEKLVFRFARKTRNKKVAVTKMIRIDPDMYTELQKICSCTPFTMSNLAKYFILPQVDKVVKEGRIDYGL